MMKALIAGFEKWGNYKTNPSQQVAENLNRKTIAGAKIIGMTLPVDFKKLPIVLKNAIKKNKPDVLITLGLTFRHKDKISLETISKRIIHPNFPDNLGKWPNNALSSVSFDIVNGKGPMTRKTTLPVNKITKRLKKSKISSIISRKAGDHMCEECLYLGRHFMEIENLNGISGHIHLPHSPSAAKDVNSKKFMDLKKIQKGVEIAIEESVKFLRKIS